MTDMAKKAPVATVRRIGWTKVDEAVAAEQVDDGAQGDPQRAQRLVEPLAPGRVFRRSRSNSLPLTDLVQERIDLGKELQSMGDGADVSAMEAAFVDVAKSYSERQGISDTA